MLYCLRCAQRCQTARPATTAHIQFSPHRTYADNVLFFIGTSAHPCCSCLVHSGRAGAARFAPCQTFVVCLPLWGQAGTLAQSSSAGANGFAISSLPSTGLISTIRVPRATVRPRGRVVSLPSSSRIVSLASSRTRFMSGS